MRSSNKYFIDSNPVYWPPSRAFAKSCPISIHTRHRELDSCRRTSASNRSLILTDLAARCTAALSQIARSLAPSAIGLEPRSQIRNYSSFQTKKQDNQRTSVHDPAPGQNRAFRYGCRYYRPGGNARRVTRWRCSATGVAVPVNRARHSHAARYRMLLSAGRVRLLVTRANRLVPGRICCSRVHRAEQEMRKPGELRFADRTAQSARLLRQRQQLRVAGAARTKALCGDDRRPRPLQGDQRSLRPPGRRRRVETVCRRRQQRRAAQRHHRPHRRRGVRRGPAQHQRLPRRMEFSDRLHGAIHQAVLNYNETARFAIPRVSA